MILNSHKVSSIGSSELTSIFLNLLLDLIDMYITFEQTILITFFKITTTIRFEFYAIIHSRVLKKLVIIGIIKNNDHFMLMTYSIIFAIGQVVHILPLTF